jgi:hypothetical protein
VEVHSQASDLQVPVASEELVPVPEVAAREPAAVAAAARVADSAVAALAAVSAVEEDNTPADPMADTP